MVLLAVRVLHSICMVWYISSYKVYSISQRPDIKKRARSQRTWHINMWTKLSRRRDHILSKPYMK